MKVHSPGPEQVIYAKAWSQSLLVVIADSILNHVRPASCTHAVPCQEARGGCRTRWQWSWPQNNWLSTRHPIIPCSHYVIAIFSCINVLQVHKAEQVFGSLICQCWDGLGPKRGLITVVDLSVGRKIHLKCHRLVSKTLCWEEKDWGGDVLLNLIFLCCASKSRDLIKESNVSLDVIVANFLS